MVSVLGVAMLVVLQFASTAYKEHVDLRYSLQAEMASIAAVLANGLPLAVASGNALAARQHLRDLPSNPGMVAVGLLDPEGRLLTDPAGAPFALRLRDPGLMETAVAAAVHKLAPRVEALRQAPYRPDSFWSDGDLFVLRPLPFGDRLLGFVYVQADLRQFWQRIAYPFG